MPQRTRINVNVPSLGQVLSPLPYPTGPTTPPFNPNAPGPVYMPPGVPVRSPEEEEEERQRKEKLSKKGTLGKIGAGLADPQTRMFLLAIANALTAPRQFGQTGTNQAVGAFTQGYNTLALSRHMQEQAATAGREEARKERVLRTQEAATTAGVSQTEAQTRQIKTSTELAPKKYDLDAMMAQSEVDYKKGTLGQRKTEAEADVKKWSEQLKLEQNRLAELTAKNAADVEQDKQRNKIAEITAKANAAQSYASAAHLHSLATKAKGGELTADQKYDAWIKAYTAFVRTKTEGLMPGADTSQIEREAAQAATALMGDWRQPQAPGFQTAPASQGGGSAAVVKAGDGKYYRTIGGKVTETDAKGNPLTRSGPQDWRPFGVRR